VEDRRIFRADMENITQLVIRKSGNGGAGSLLRDRDIIDECPERAVIRQHGIEEFARLPRLLHAPGFGETLSDSIGPRFGQQSEIIEHGDCRQNQPLRVLLALLQQRLGCVIEIRAFRRIGHCRLHGETLSARR
jgi:hypothetical protein